MEPIEASTYRDNTEPSATEPSATEPSATDTGYLTQYQDSHVVDCKVKENQVNTQERNISAMVSPKPDSERISRYLDYPTTKPFINTDYTRADGPVNTYPTSDRDAVISALRNLQENVKKLEIERNIAEQNLQSVTSGTEQFKELLDIGKQSGKNWNHQEHQSNEGTYGETMKARELEGQLLSAEHRCQQLEKQLEQMRKMVDNSEQNRRELMEQTRKMQQRKDMTGADIKLHMERINELEREQRRLTLTQTLAESKIRELEQRVRNEKIHRQTLQGRTAQLESAAQTKTLPSSSSSQAVSTALSSQVRKTKKSSKKKKKTVPSKHSSSRCSSEPMRHYRLNLAEIPFVAGQSTGPSHSLGANVQNVLAMLKLHNTALCSRACSHNGDCQRSNSLSSSDSGDVDANQDLSALLSQLQDEFGQLSSKHQEVIDHIHLASDPQVKKTLEQELGMLLENMENKSQQISIIRQHQRKTGETKKVKISPTRGTKSRQMQAASKSCRQSRHHLYNANINNGNMKSRSHTCNKLKDSTSLERPELFILRDIQKLQCTLRKEDLFWE